MFGRRWKPIFRHLGKFLLDGAQLARAPVLFLPLRLAAICGLAICVFAGIISGGTGLGGTAIIPAIVCVLGIRRVIPDALVAGFMVFIIHAHLPILFLARTGGLIVVCHLHPLNRIRKNATIKMPSRSRKLTKVMHEFTEKIGMTFANFLELGPHSQPKRKLINISGEWGHYLYLHKKGQK